MTDSAPRTIRLLGRVFLDFEIRTLTGLHIGGAPGTLAIGNVDNPVIRNPFTNEPYIPGSSLRGKMRSQLEKLYGAEQNTSIGSNVMIHSARTAEQYAGSLVSQVFGIPAAEFLQEPTRLVVRDAFLTAETKTDYASIRTDLPFTEVKWEAAIDRVTSAATPRQQERVPAGAAFAGALTFSLYNDLRRDLNLFGTVIRGLQLVEEDYLGGQGARGSGQVRFERINLRVHPTDQEPLAQAKLASLEDVKAAWEQMRRELA
jgi:CRISPR-associated protein Csm3